MSLKKEDLKFDLVDGKSIRSSTPTLELVRIRQGIRVTHIPTGMEVTVFHFRKMHDNRNCALNALERALELNSHVRK